MKIKSWRIKWIQSGSRQRSSSNARFHFHRIAPTLCRFMQLTSKFWLIFMKICKPKQPLARLQTLRGTYFSSSFSHQSDTRGHVKVPPSHPGSYRVEQKYGFATISSSRDSAVIRMSLDRTDERTDGRTDGDKRSHTSVLCTRGHMLIFSLLPLHWWHTGGTSGFGGLLLSGCLHGWLGSLSLSVSFLFVFNHFGSQELMQICLHCCAVQGQWVKSVSSSPYEDAPILCTCVVCFSCWVASQGWRKSIGEFFIHCDSGDQRNIVYIGHGKSCSCWGTFWTCQYLHIVFLFTLGYAG